MLIATPEERSMSRELLIQCPDGQMKTVPLTGGRLSIGRSSAAELCFPEDAGLSRQHFAFEPDGEEWTVQDLGSKNGTFINGEKIGQREKQRQADATMVAPVRQELNDGDELRICNNIFAVVLSDSLVESPRIDLGQPVG